MDKDPNQKDDVRIVRSDLAPPSRVGGYFGVRQPIMPDPPVYPPKEPVSDADLQEAVRAALAADGRVGAEAISVSVSAAVVTLTGEVALEFQRTLSEAVTQSVPGVLNVNNKVEVKS